MFDRYLRPVKDRTLAVIIRALGIRLHPTLLTLIAFLIGCASVAAILLGLPVAALLLWLGSRILDGLDGAVARAAERQSDFGGYLDIVLDMILYAAIPLAISLRSGGRWELMATCLLLAVFVVNGASWMYLAAILEKRGTGRSGELTTITMPRGLIEGTETIIFYSLFIVLPRWFGALQLLMAALTAVNILQRIIWASRRLPPRSDR